MSPNLRSIVDLYTALDYVRRALDYVSVYDYDYVVLRDMYNDMYDRLRLQLGTLSSADYDYYMSEYGIPDYAFFPITGEE